MKKILVETKGSYMLHDLTTGCEIPHDRPAVVIASAFIDQRISKNQIKVLEGDLTDEATDAEFQKSWDASDGKRDLAVDSFLSEYKVEAAPVKPAPRGGKKAND